MGTDATNTCETCKHWDDKTVGKRDRVTYDEYAPRRYCWLLSGEESKDSVTEQNDAMAAALGVGGANIATGPKFGCIHHEPK